jgi:hypothetical protein
LAPLFADLQATSVAGYADALANLPQNRNLWFRGQTNRNWGLVPGLVRSRGANWPEAESRLLTRFRQNALPLVPTGTRTDIVWDWLLLMQHYGVPTRLLDWTENALAGLYFAVTTMRGSITGRTDGCVWVLDPVGLNDESTFGALGEPIPTLGVGNALDDYLPGVVTAGPRALPPVAVLAMRMFPRLVAQSGVFTLGHRATQPIERISRGAYVGRIVVPRAAKSGVFNELTRLGVTRLSLFPELESVAENAKSYLA